MDLPPEERPPEPSPQPAPAARFWRRPIRVGRPPFLSRLAIAVIAVFLVGGSVLTYFVLSTPADLSPPSRVTGLVVTDHFDGDLEVSWFAAMDNVGVTSYRIYRDARRVGEVSSSVTSYRDQGLPVDVVFEYRVNGVDAVGNEGPWSEPVRADSAPAPPDITFAAWTLAGASEWNLPIASSSKTIDLRRFEVTVTSNGSAIVVPPTSLEALPVSRGDVTLTLIDAGATGRLDDGDAFQIGGVRPGLRYTLNLLYVPASSIVATASLET